MEIRISRFRLSQRLVIPFVFVLLLLSPCADCQEADQTLTAEWKDSILENQRFTLKFISPYPGKQNVNIQDPRWPGGIQKVSGPYTAQRTVQKEDGSFATVLQIIYTLRSGGAGIYRIPPVRVTPRWTAGQTGPLPQALSSSELFIPVLQSDERHLSFPLILNWGEIPGTLYAGQSFPLILVMNNLEEIDLPESVSLPSPGGAILENVEGLGDIGFSSLSERTLFNVPMDAWMLTPSREGTLTLPAAEVSIAGVRRTTSREKITVLPLPEQVQDSGAVGEFSLTAELTESTVLPGSSLSLRIRIDGTGNLNYLNMPEPVFPDDLTSSVRDESEIRASSEGYSGWREKVYTLRPETLNQYEIIIPSYSWLNPGSGEVETRNESRLVFSVAGNPAVSGDSDSFTYSLMTLSGSKKSRGWTLYRIPSLYLLLLPGFLFLAAILFIRKVRPAILSVLLFSLLFLSASSDTGLAPKWIGEAESFFSQGRYTSALDLYRENAAGWEGNGSYLYNRGVLSFLSGEHARGIVNLRKAMVLMPLNRQISDNLESMEEQLKLENQHRIRLFVHPDLLLLLLVLGLNGAMIALSYCFIRKTSLPILLFLLLSSLSLVAGVELLRSSWLLNRPLAVLKEEGIVKKIPEAIGSDWLTLPEGTSLDYKKQEGDYMLVNTAYGLEGWIREDQLIFLNRRSAGEF